MFYPSLAYHVAGERITKEEFLKSQRKVEEKPKVHPNIHYCISL